MDDLQIRRNGPKPYDPSPETRMVVRALSANGLTREQIATYLRIDLKTLRKNFEEELRDGFATIYASISGKLVQKALAGDITSIIFWLRTQAKWSTTNRHEVSGINGAPIDVRQLSTEQIIEVLAATAAEDDSSGTTGRVEPEESEEQPSKLV